MKTIEYDITIRVKLPASAKVLTMDDDGRVDYHKEDPKVDKWEYADMFYYDSDSAKRLFGIPSDNIPHYPRMKVKRVKP